MRSRSYYAIAVSSFLLLTTSCFAQKAKQDDPGERPTVDVPIDVRPDEKKADEKKADVKEDPPPDETGDGPEDTSGHPAAADGGDETGDDGETGAAVGTSPSHKGKDGCHPGQMRFDGKCLSKDRVAKILDRREEEALAKVKHANKPKQVADAAYELIEQQTQQVEKVEDDLDEIIEQLKQEKAQKEKADKEKADKEKGGP